jgi:hypothetical protein
MNKVKRTKQKGKDLERCNAMLHNIAMGSPYIVSWIDEKGETHSDSWGTLYDTLLLMGVVSAHMTGIAIAINNKAD